MTSPINNFQDILNAMENNPTLRDALRRHILTDELLQVPARLDRMEGDISSLRDDVTGLKEGQARLEEGQARLETELARLGGHVSRLTGADYETYVATYVHRHLRRGLGINATVFSTQRDRTALTTLLDEAESQGLIEPADTDELNKTDLVLKADRPTDYLLAEVSITIQQDDIDRAARWATLLAKATARTVTPFAIGAREHPNIQRQHVQVILIPEPQPEPQTP